MADPIEKLAELASEDQHAALYDLLVGAASEIPAATEDVEVDDEREEAA